MSFGRCLTSASSINQYSYCPLIKTLKTLLGISRQSYFSSCAHLAVKPFAGFSSITGSLPLLLPSAFGYSIARAVYGGNSLFFPQARGLATTIVVNRKQLYSALLPSSLALSVSPGVIQKAHLSICNSKSISIGERNSDIKHMAPLADNNIPKNYGRTDVQLSKQLIYCNGPLLDAVQQSKMFHDCKHFVDMPLKLDPSSTLEDWQNLVNSGKLDDMSLRMFIEKHFDEPGGELDEIQPIDFNPDFSFDNIACPSYRQWAKELHQKWPMLCRKVSDRVLAEPQRFSLIVLPKPFVVPGGRFREMYYWDSFFTMKGLLASKMYQTVRGMIENMGHLVDQFGYIPNGNRVYYLNRSQPPLLTWCLYSYYEASGDKDFLLAGMKWLEKELQFFQSKKSIQLPGIPSLLYRYHVITDGPRPESYREDVETAMYIEDVVEKKRLWGDIAAAAESGRDFSSRWFSNEGPEAGKMGSTRTSSILPVDLNAIICGNWSLMAKLYIILGDKEKSQLCWKNFEAMRKAIYQVFWNEERGCWFDYDIANRRHVDVYQDTNFFPLFTGCTHDGFDSTVVVNYMERIGALGYPGGLPSSLVTSGQQWDFPNAWAPTTWVVIQGLRAHGKHELAFQIANKWIRKNYDIWLCTGGRMFEKYNVASECIRALGGGGEYDVQEGFGWTNGVILDLLVTYGSQLSYSPKEKVLVCGCCHSGDKLECKLQ
uniref:Trehalase n=1 Tax=Syphacia muris TaxID=451379 RepID=A0A158R5V2_9BILA